MRDAGDVVDLRPVMDPEQQRRILRREAAEMEARVRDPHTIEWPPVGRWRRVYRHLLTEAEKAAMDSEEAEQGSARRRR